MFSRSSRAALVVLAVLALLAAACGSSSSSNSQAKTDTKTTTSAASGEVAAAKDFVQKYLAQPTDFPLSKSSLSKKPDKKTVGFVVCPDPACVELGKYIKEATSALGWDLKEVNANDWSDPGGAIQQLIDAHVDYISLTGFPMAQYQSQMQEMKDKGIPLFQSYVTDVPQGKANNLYADGYDASSAKVFAKVIVDWIIADSNGKANVLNVTLGTTPILDAQVDAAKAEFTQSCPSCKVKVLSGTQNDAATGAIPQMVTSYLQSNPDTNYVYFAYSTLATGVASALKSAGLEGKVKIVGTQGFAPQFQDVIDGAASAWTALPSEFSMWTLADQMARYAAGEWSLDLERKSAVPPLYVVSSADQAKAVVGLKAGWPGPTGFKDTFKKLWHVS